MGDRKKTYNYEIGNLPVGKDRNMSLLYEYWDTQLDIVRCRGGGCLSQQEIISRLGGSTS